MPVLWSSLALGKRGFCFPRRFLPPGPPACLFSGGGQIPEEPICSLTPSVLQVSTSRSPFPPRLCLPLPLSYLGVSFPAATRSPNHKDLEAVVPGTH